MQLGRNDFFNESIIIDVPLDVPLQLRGKTCSFGDCKQGVQLDLQIIIALINFVDDCLQIADGIGVKGETNNHPEDSCDFFSWSQRVDIAVAHSCESSEGPVHSRCVFVSDTSFQ